jgi:hypothetical protein
LIRFAIGRPDGIGVDQVEDFAEIDRETIASLSYKYTALTSAAVYSDSCDLVVGVGLVVRDRFVTDIVERLDELRRICSQVRAPNSESRLGTLCS